MAINAEVARSHQGRRALYFYRSPYIAVTRHGIETDEGLYLFRDLSQIHRAHLDAHPARRLATIFGIIEVLLAMPFAVLYGSVAVLAAGIVLGVVFGVAHVVDSRNNPRWMALQAAYFGEEITLFQSCDQQEFEQVRRAVIRAVEANRPRL